MKKYLSAIIAVFILLVSFAGCADTGNGEISLSEEDTSAVVDNYAIVYNNVTIHVGDLMEGKSDCLLKKLGTPVSSTATNSCAYLGLDKTYDYPGFTIATYPDGDYDYVLSITFTDDSMKTESGIHIGSTFAELKAVYGETEAKNGIVTYQSGKTIVSARISDDKVAKFQLDLDED